MKIETELETFPSTYKKDYKWFENVTPSEQYKDFDAYELSEEDRAKFLREDKIKDLNPEEKDVIMAKMRAKLMQSVYAISYGLESLQMFKGDPDKLYNPENDKLITIARDVYKIRYPWFKTLLPLPTSRRVCGFCAPRDYYYGVSEYQDTISRNAYHLLKNEAEKGHWRLGPKKICEPSPTILKCKK